MGRHRTDPLGLARIAAAVLGAVLALGLVVVGGVALWGAVTTSSSQQTAKSSPRSDTAPKTTKTTSSPSPASEALVVRCNAAQCKVYIAIPGSNTQLFNGMMNKGDERRYDEPQLTLVVYDSATVTVMINGRLQPTGASGEERTYEITKQ